MQTMALALDVAFAAYDTTLASEPTGFLFQEELFPYHFSGLDNQYADASMRALVYQSQQDNVLYVGFRGSSNLGNWLENIGFITDDSLPEGYRKFTESVIQKLQVAYPHRTILVTGHSAGAAMSVYAALQTGWECYGFDCPDLKALQRQASERWSNVHLVQAGSIVSGTGFKEIKNLGSLLELGVNEGNALSCHSLDHMAKRIRRLDNTGRLSEAMGLSSDAIDDRTRAQVNLLVSHFRHEARQQAFELMLTSASTLYQTIGKLGQQTTNITLCRLAVIGQNLIQVHQSLTQCHINISFLGRFAQLSSLLSPLFSLISAGVALFQMFGLGRRHSADAQQLGQLLGAIQQLQQDMRAHFQQVFAGQLQIYQAIERLTALTQAGLARLDSKLDKVQITLDGLEQKIGAIRHEQVHSQLKQDANAIKSIEHEIEQLAVCSKSTREVRLLAVLQKLELHLTQASTEFKGIEVDIATLNGWYRVNQLQPLCQRLEFAHFGVDTSRVVNAVRWQTLVGVYFQLPVQYFQTAGVRSKQLHHRILERIESDARVLMGFIDTLAAPGWIKTLFTYYQNELNSIREANDALVAYLKEFNDQTNVHTLLDFTNSANNGLAGNDKDALQKAVDKHSDKSAILATAKRLLQQQIVRYNAKLADCMRHITIVASIFQIDTALVASISTISPVSEDYFDALAQKKTAPHSSKMPPAYFYFDGIREGCFKIVDLPNIPAIQQSIASYQVSLGEYCSRIRHTCAFYRTFVGNNPNADHSTFLRRQALDEVYTTIRLLQPVITVARQAEGRNVAIVLGGTGCGKSTMLNYLYGCDYEKNHNQLPIKAQLKADSKPEVCKVGDSKVLSETLIPRLVEVNYGKESLAFCDMPGFFETRDKQKQTCAALAPYFVAKQAQSIKGLIWMVSKSELEATRADTVKSMLSYLLRICNHRSEQLAQSLIIIMTKQDRLSELVTRLEALRKNMDEAADANLRNAYQTIYEAEKVKAMEQRSQIVTNARHFILEEILHAYIDELNDEEERNLLTAIYRALRQKPNNIIISDICEADGRDHIIHCVKQLPGYAASNFKFLDYNEQAKRLPAAIQSIARKYTTEVAAVAAERTALIQATQEKQQTLQKQLADYQQQMATDRPDNYVLMETVVFRHDKQQVTDLAGWGRVDTNSPPYRINVLPYLQGLERQGYRLYAKHHYRGGDYSFDYRRVRDAKAVTTAPIQYLTGCALRVKTGDEATFHKHGVFGTVIPYRLGVSTQATLEIFGHKSFMALDEHATLYPVVKQHQDTTKACLLAIQTLQQDIVNLNYKQQELLTKDTLREQKLLDYQAVLQNICAVGELLSWNSTEEAQTFTAFKSCISEFKLQSKGLQASSHTLKKAQSYISQISLLPTPQSFYRDLSISAPSSALIAAKPQAVTQGGGDCAFHAVLGRPQDNFYVCTDVQAKRQQMAIRIRDCRPNKGLYRLIIEAIKAMIAEREATQVEGVGDAIIQARQQFQSMNQQAEGGFKTKWDKFEQVLQQDTSLMEDITKFINSYTSRNNFDKADYSLKVKFQLYLGESDKNGAFFKARLEQSLDLKKAYRDYNAKDGFDWSPILSEQTLPGLIKAYADYIETPGHWLLPVDLQIMAKVFNVCVQYSTRNPRGGQSSEEVYNANGKDKVTVRFNGVDHFERLPTLSITPNITRATDPSGDFPGRGGWLPGPLLAPPRQELDGGCQLKSTKASYCKKLASNKRGN